MLLLIVHATIDRTPHIVVITIHSTDVEWRCGAGLAVCYTIIARICELLLLVQKMLFCMIERMNE